MVHKHFKNEQGVPTSLLFLALKMGSLTWTAVIYTQSDKGVPHPSVMVTFYRIELIIFLSYLKSSHSPVTFIHSNNTYFIDSLQWSLWDDICM